MIVGDCSIFSLVFLVSWNDVNYDMRGYFYRKREKKRLEIEIFDMDGSLAGDLVFFGIVWYLLFYSTFYSFFFIL